MPRFGASPPCDDRGPLSIHQQGTSIEQTMGQIVDDKSQYCIPFILERLNIHRERYAGNENAPPFFLGLNGVQGAGKTVLVRRNTGACLIDIAMYP
jgi:pantothenate kinase-related protein Tda10